jgi:glucokinase
VQVLGVDIGGTTVKLAVVETETGSIKAESSFKTPRTTARNIAFMTSERVDELIARFPDVTRIGVGVPGAMNKERTIVRYPPNLVGWKEEPLYDYLKEALPHLERIEVDNDAKCAGLAEARFGVGRDTSHFLFVILGTGVGGCIYSTEQGWQGIYRGASGGAGEFGHTSIDLNGAPCGCGSRGCIEAYLGQNYLTQRTAEKLQSKKSIKSVLATATDLSPKVIADAMNAGDAFARSVFEEAGMLLGRALANVANLLDMNVFILGGGVSDAGKVLIDATQESLIKNVMENLKPVVEVRKAALGNKAGVVGAALLVS